MTPTEKQNKQTLRTIGKMLDDGLETVVEPFPETEKEFLEIVGQLRRLPPGDLKGKLVLSGFLNKPYGEEKLRCMECINFLVNRKWCDLPELAVPVEPEWYCRLWRI